MHPQRYIIIMLICFTGYITVHSVLIVLSKDMHRVGTDQLSGNRIRIEQAVYSPIHEDNVLLGSSLSAGLQLPNTLNLALQGGAVIDGLEALSFQQELPKRCWIEINVLQRTSKKLIPPDHDIKKHLPFLQHRNSPSVLTMSALKSIQSEKSDLTPNTIPERNEKETTKWKQLVKRQQEIQNSPINPTKNCNHYKQLRKKILELQNKGVELIFYEVPREPLLADSPQATSLRNWVYQNFPEHSIFQPELKHFQTTDGIHLSSVAREEFENILGKNSCLSSPSTH